MSACSMAIMASCRFLYAAAVQALHRLVGLLLLPVGRGDQRLEDIAEMAHRLAVGNRGGRRGGRGEGQQSVHGHLPISRAFRAMRLADWMVVVFAS